MRKCGFSLGWAWRADTATNAGVSLVYENGELCYAGHTPTPRTTTLIMECDRNVEFAVRRAMIWNP